MNYKLKPTAILLKEGSAPIAVQLLRVGKFSHPVYGDFEITKDTLLSFKKNFDDRVRGIDLAIDYSHNNEDEAAGWIKDLILKEDGNQIWAEVAWTPEGKKSLEQKEFRYLSADFAFEYESEETKESFGPTLLGAGLTNRPFVKDMSPAVELKERTGGKMELKELDQKIVKLQESIEAITKRLPVEKEVNLSEIEKENLKLKEENKRLVDDKAASEKKAADEKKLAEKQAAFAALLKEGKVCKAQEKAFLEDNMQEFLKLAEKLNTEGAGHSGSEGEGKEGSAEAQLLKLAEKKLADKGAKTLAEAQRIVIRENPELYAKALAEAQG